MVGLIKFEDNTVLDTYVERGLITGVVWLIRIPMAKALPVPVHQAFIHTSSCMMGYLTIPVYFIPHDD